MKKIIFQSKLDKYVFNDKVIFLNKLCEKKKNFDLNDLKKLINIYYDKWLNDAKKIHLFLSKNYFNKTGKYWWLTDSSRFILWKTKSEYSLKDYLYSRAIIKLIEADQQQSNFIIIEGNFSIFSYVQKKLSKNYILINNDLNINNNKLICKIFVQFIKIIFLNIIYAFKLIMQLKFKKKIDNFKNFKNAIVSIAINEKIIKERNDHFFGNMFDKYKNDFLWIYSDIPKSKKSIIKFINNSKRKHIFALEFGDLVTISESYFECLMFYLRIIFLYKILKKKIDNNFWQFYYEEFFFNKLIFENIFYEIYLYKIYKKIFKLLKINKIILPYEESSWQKSIILASQNYNHILYGYAHASHTQAHKFFFNKNDNINPPRPNKILVTGKIPRLNFLNLSYNKNDLIKIGSGKFHKKRNIYNYKKIKKPKILFICGLGFEIINFSKFLKCKKDFFSKYELFIRENPHSWASETKIAKKIFYQKGIDYKVSNLSLIQDVITSKYILFETSTAGFEAILLGRLGMQINITDNIFSDHFNDINRKNLKYFMDFEDLEKGLKNYESFSEEEYNSYVDKQISKVQSIIEKPNIKNFILNLNFKYNLLSK
jgi:hypothetical protein